MAKVQWTKDQQKVIDLRKRNILVSAAAGSGKTAVLVERIITMITQEENPVDIDRLLIVTFTNAAAAEMRERIGKAIEKKISENPDNLHLQKQMTLLHSAQITTIHSFCLHVIRNYFNVIDLDPGFRVGDEAELKLLKSDVIEELLEDKYQEGKGEFVEFVESYSPGKTDEQLEKIILQLYEFSMSYPWPITWLEERKKAFQVADGKSMEETIWMQYLLDYINMVLEDLKYVNRRATEVCREEGGPYTYLEALEDDQQMLYDLSKMDTYDRMNDYMESISWKKLSSKKDTAITPEKREMVKSFREQVKSGIGDLKKNYFFQSTQEMVKDMQGVKSGMDTLVSLTIEFSQAFREKKEEKNLVDFSDLEHFALDILVKKNDENHPVPTWVAEEFSEFYEEILIDEYQDSNMVQETILNSISRERLGCPNLFMVGDVKQSIYKFRLARPELFMDKYDKYQVEDSLYQRIDLHKNFRSREVVLGFTNFIFRQIMTKELGNIVYDQDAALYLGAQFQETNENISTTGEILVVTPEEEVVVEVELSEEEEFSLKELEARAIAARIKELVDDYGLMIQGEEGYRKVRYRDIVILLRTMSNWADVFSETLMAEGIPAFADTQTGYFSTLEVKTVLSYLKIIDNPRQDIPLAVVLRSPIGKMDDEELAQIRKINKKTDLFDDLLSYEDIGGNPEIKRKVKVFLTQWRQFRSMVPYTVIHDLVIEVFHQTNYYEYVSVMPGGSRRKANLDMLLQKAMEFEGTSYKGLFHFNRYMEKLDKYQIDFGEASVSNENEDAVRIMSIHKSKGLEFPVVFASGFGKEFNKQEVLSPIIFHPDFGLGPDYIDIKMRTKSPTLIKKVIQRRSILENLGEELRILYVAMTRAKEKLILTGGVKNLAKKQKEWELSRSAREDKLRFIQLASAKNYLDWVVPAIQNQDLLQRENVEIQIRFVTPSMLVKEEVASQITKEWTKEGLLKWDSSIVYHEELKERLNDLEKYRYPYKQEGQLPSKLTVSELKRASKYVEEELGEMLFQREKVVEAYIPSFMEAETVSTGAQRGTVYHKVMENYSFESGDRESIQKELEELQVRKKITMEEMEVIDIRKIEQFACSNLAERMKRAKDKGELYREQPFVFGMEAKEIYSQLNSEEVVLIQGVLDCYFQEEDGLVLVDYKTDWVDHEEKLIEKYRTQLDFYKEALERLTHVKVKERYLYSFHFGKEIIL